MTLLKGNCLETLKTLETASVDSIVTDPPYELGFMGKSWDNSGIAYSQDLWAECLRVLKPGGHLLAFSGSRTYHRMTVAIEDAGFEIRDQIAWISNKTFPKSLNVSKAIDKAAGLLQHEAKAFTVAGRTDANLPNPVTNGYVPPEPQTVEAQQWQGWGTALKPSLEPICMARKPLIGTVANNVLTYGTGALNIDGSKVGTDVRHNPSNSNDGTTAVTWTQGRETLGRWPSNVIHDGSDEVLAGFTNKAARFFYCAKASKSERNAGLEGLPNFHPTVKPLALMRYLIKLVTPPGGIVLDPFLGSGTTAMAAVMEGFDWVGCEMTEDYWPIIEARVEWAKNQQQPML